MLRLYPPISTSIISKIYMISDYIFKQDIWVITQSRKGPQGWHYTVQATVQDMTMAAGVFGYRLCPLAAKITLDWHLKSSVQECAPRRLVSHFIQLNDGLFVLYVSYYMCASTRRTPIIQY